MRVPIWTEQHDEEFARLAKEGYSALRLRVRFGKSAPFVAARAKALGIELKKPLRLPRKSEVEVQPARGCADTILSTGNGSAPSCVPFQLGQMIVTTLPPHTAHRALRLRTSPDASAPHRMMNGASAAGMPLPHAWQ
jgi:hypothetical protein